MARGWYEVFGELVTSSKTKTGVGSFPKIYRNLSVGSIKDSLGNFIFIKGVNTLPEEFRNNSFNNSVAASLDAQLATQLKTFYLVDFDEEKTLDEQVPFYTTLTDTGALLMYVETDFVRSTFVNIDMNFKAKADLAAYMFVIRDATSPSEMSYYVKRTDSAYVSQEDFPLPASLTINIAGEVLTTVDIDDQASVIVQNSATQAGFGVYEGAIYENPFIASKEECIDVGGLILNRYQKLGTVTVVSPFLQSLLNRGVGSALRIERFDGTELESTLETLSIGFDATGRLDMNVEGSVNTIPRVVDSVPLQVVNDPFRQINDHGCDPNYSNFLVAANITVGANVTMYPALPVLMSANSDIELKALPNPTLVVGEAPLWVLRQDVDEALSDQIPYWEEPASNTTTTPTLTDPTTAPTLALNAIGRAMWVGTYKYKIVFVDSAGNTTLGGPEATIVITDIDDSVVSLTNIEIGPAGTVDRYIYRTYVDGTVFHFVGSIGDNVTTSYDDFYYDTDVHSGRWDFEGTIVYKNSVLELDKSTGSIIATHDNNFLLTNNNESMVSFDPQSPLSLSPVGLVRESIPDQVLTSFNRDEFAGFTTPAVGNAGDNALMIDHTVSDGIYIFAVRGNTIPQNKIYVFNASTLAYVSQFTVTNLTGGTIFSLALDRASNRLYVMYWDFVNPPAIDLFDTGTFALVSTLVPSAGFQPDSPEEKAVYHNGYFYTASWSSALGKAVPTRIDMTTGDYVTFGDAEFDPQIGDWPVSISIDATQNKLYAAFNSAHGVEPFYSKIAVYNLTTLVYESTLFLESVGGVEMRVHDMKVGK